LAATFPTLDAYLAALPEGLDSYPSCVVKGSVVRSMVSDGLFRTFAPDLPPTLKALVDSPPLASIWMPEVHQLSLLIAAHDGHFARAGGEAAFLGWGDRASQAMIKSPLYRAVFALAGPKLLLEGLARRAETLRRGTTLSVVDKGEGWAILHFRFPSALYTPLLLKARARSLRGAVEVGGGKRVAVHVEDVTATGCTFRVEYG
jgi:uncharacterized protein (TIGR02265 family)